MKRDIAHQLHISESFYALKCSVYMIIQHKQDIKYQTNDQRISLLLFSDHSQHGPEVTVDSSSSQPSQAAENEQPESGAESKHAGARARSRRQEDEGSPE